MRIFITGTTGYLGGSIATRLVADGHQVRGLARTAATAAALSERGIEAVLGHLDDTPTLAAEARAADAVINAADSDHRGAVDTLVEALVGSGKPLLHTSGSSIVGEPSNGQFEDRIYTEDDVAKGSGWQPAPEKAARVAIDRTILDAAGKDIAAVVLCNSMVFGTGRGMKPDSVQIPRLIATARRTGVARHIGAGHNAWSNVHIDDTTDLYLRALGEPRPGAFYFVESGEATFLDITQAIADRYSTAGPLTIAIEDAIVEWGYEPAVYALGSNSRVRSVNARHELGWQPNATNVADWIRTEPVP